MNAQLLGRREPITFTPGLAVADPFAAYWVRQAVLRLRREVCWIWRDEATRGRQSIGQHKVGRAPDPVSAALDLSRLRDERSAFFAEDPSARYLSEMIESAAPALPQDPKRGSLAWIALELSLTDAEMLTVSVALVHAWDAAAGEVIGEVQGDSRRNAPSLGLLQRLGDHPEAFLDLTSASHPLFRYGILRSEGPGAVGWNSPITMPSLLVSQIITGKKDPPPGFEPVSATNNLPISKDLSTLANRLREPAQMPSLVPLRSAMSQGLLSLATRSTLCEVSKVTRRPIYTTQGLTGKGNDWSAVCSLCWLQGRDLLVDKGDWEEFTGIEGLAAPIYVFLATDETHLEATVWKVLAGLDVPSLSVEDRMAIWQRRLGELAPPLKDLREASFRFRFNEGLVEEIADSVVLSGKAVDRELLFSACQQNTRLDPAGLAVRVEPRFDPDELVLPPAQSQQFEELVKGMQSLAEVHTEWGTGKAWDNAGISALFAGPPGTGKTMAAEVLAARLGLPMYRVDLSQVVNKYIGETEKNLRKLFDSAEESEVLLFFDEADALFGQRTEVKSSHDRYANLEVSYLLQRMERFRGLAVLATNRRKDLDDAFLRRLRMVIEFPMPEPAERKRIWMRAIPAAVDATALDFEHLAQQFPLSGGHIRSIVFHACLQSAGGEKKLEMRTLMGSVKREYEKLDRKPTREQFGRWEDLLQ